MLIRTLRFLAGAAAGFLFWWYATPVYNTVLASAAEQIVRFDKRLCGPRAQVADRAVFVAPRDCVAPTATVPADQLTFNIILLGGLFAMGGRNALAFIVSCLIVFATHVGSLAVSIMTTYSNANGAWSLQHYSEFERQLWLGTEFFWRLAGMFAVVFACWWISQSRRPAQ